MKKIYNNLFFNDSRNIVLFLIFLVLLFPISIANIYYITANNHSLGSELGYDYWYKNGFQWGSDIIQNIGPLGWMHFPQSYTGIMDIENAVCTILFSLLLINLMGLQAIRQKYILYFVIPIYGIVQSLKVSIDFTMPAEVNHYLLVLFIAYQLFISTNILVITFLVAVIALLSLGKGMFLFIGMFTIVIIGIYYLQQKKFKQCYTTILTYVISMMVFWIGLADQKLANFLLFVQSSIEFSKGYNDSLSGYNEDIFYYKWTSIILMLICIAIFSSRILGGLLISFRSCNFNRFSPIVLLTLLEAFILFACWKHAIVSSATYHSMVFILFCIITIPIFWGNILSKSNMFFYPEKKYGYFDYGLMLYVVLGIFAFVIGEENYLPNIRYLFQTKQELAIWDKKLTEYNKNTVPMPKIKEIVRNERISYFGQFPQPVIANDFNYHAHPSTISFTGWTDYMIKKDAEFFRDNSAPPYLLYQLYDAFMRRTGIVRQFSLMDNHYAQMEIFRRYEPVKDALHRPVEELGRLLLKRRTPASEITFNPIESNYYSITDKVKVPITNNPLRAIIRFPDNWMTKITSILYKSPVYSIEYELDNGEKYERKFTPTKAKHGFMIAPIIIDNLDFLQALSKDTWQRYQQQEKEVPLRRMTAFKIRCIHPLFACTDQMEVSFETIKGLEFGRINTIDFWGKDY